jgi:hypothetical protein
MPCRSALYLLSAIAVVGCGRGGPEAQKNGALAEDKRPNQSATPNKTDVSIETNILPEPAKQATPEPVVYSSRELAKVLDFSALPALDGTKFEHQSAAAASAQVPGTVPEVSAFYQRNLSALGWQLVPEPERKNTDEYASVSFEKKGHRASLTVSNYDVSKDKGPLTLVSMRFHGNLDTRTLPTPPGNRLLLASQTVTSYLTENAVPEAVSWASKELAAEGWQRFTLSDAAKEETGENRTLHFRKQGYALSMFIGINPLYKKTHFQYSVSALGHELPTPPDAAKVRFDDVRWELACEVPGGWKAAAEFYQKAMPALGCQPLPGEDPRPTYWNLRFGTEAGDVIMVQVSSKDGQMTRVSIHGIPAAVLAAMKKRDEEKKVSPK